MSFGINSHKYLVTLAAAVLTVFSADAQGMLNRGRNLRNGLRRPMNGQNQQANQGAAAGQPVLPNRIGDPTKDAPESGGRSIEFNQAAVDLVYKVYGDLTGKTILRDPQAPNPTITLQPKQGQELSDEDKILALETVLEMNGIHLEPYGDKFMRAVPRKEARKEGVPLILDPDAVLGETTRVVSFMLQFKNIGVEDAQKALDNFKSASGIIIGFERTNSLLLTDTEANVNRMREISRVIDVATPVLENVFVRQIKNASANDIKTALEAIVQESQKDLTDAQKKGNVPGARGPAAPMQPPRLLGRPQNQPAAPVANQSLVMGVSDADRGMIRGKVLILADERSNKLIVVTQKSNMDFFDKVIEQLDIETTPDTVVKVYRLKYAEAEDVSDMINDLIGNSSSSKNSGKANQNQNSKQGGGGNLSTGHQTGAKKPANQRTGESKAGELSKENTTVLADKRINGLVVMTDKELVPTIESIIESMDIKLSQVLIETVIVEVGLGDGLETGVDWLQLGKKQKVVSPVTRKTANENGELVDSPVYKVFTKAQTTTDDDGNVITKTGSFTGETLTAAEFKAKYGEGTDGEYTLSAIPETITSWVRGGLWNGGSTQYMTGGGGGTGKDILNTLVAVGTNAVEDASLLSPAGSGLNLFLKSETLNLGAVIKAAQTDSRSKYLASPIIMTLDNKEAKIEATEMRYLFKGYQYSGSSMQGTAVPDYEQKELGITIKMTPKINPNGTIMLTIEEEYSQEGSGQSITASDGKSMISAATTITRKMSADALLENGQTAVFAGLTQTTKSMKEGGIPLLKDIPWIGKYLFGYTQENEARSELLVFMTPHVLDDAKVAQAEALRRKKSMSDPNPWDDHGWSLSPLADPVSKREQLRRLEDEWKRQDEERKTKIAIEQEKVKRAKALREMSKEERNLWLKMHKEELEKEQQEELEKKMLDKDSQEGLRKLAEEIRAEKLGDADKELKKMEEMTASENERGRLDAEKAEKAKEAAQTEEAKPADEAKPKEEETTP